LHPTKNVDADADQYVIDGVATEARSHQDSGDFGTAAIDTKQDVVRPLQPDGTAGNVFDCLGDGHSGDKRQR